MQIFEAYGLGEEVIETSFRGSVSRIGGMSLADLQAEAEDFHAKGFPEKAMSKLEDYGFIQSRPKGMLPCYPFFAFCHMITDVGNSCTQSW